MTLRHNPKFVLLSSVLLVAFALTGCSKEDLVAPHSDALGSGKARAVSVAGTDSDQSAAKPGSTGDNSSISDDGDDVGDGERNRKKKPNS